MCCGADLGTGLDVVEETGDGGVRVVLRGGFFGLTKCEEGHLSVNGHLQ